MDARIFDLPTEPVSVDQSLSPWCPCLRRRTIDGCLR
jgi:hypothetical protein